MAWQQFIPNITHHGIVFIEQDPGATGITYRTSVGELRLVYGATEHVELNGMVLPYNPLRTKNSVESVCQAYLSFTASSRAAFVAAIQSQASLVTVVKGSTALAVTSNTPAPTVTASVQSQATLATHPNFPELTGATADPPYKANSTGDYMGSICRTPLNQVARIGDLDLPIRYGVPEIVNVMYRIHCDVHEVFCDGNLVGVHVDGLSVEGLSVYNVVSPKSGFNRRYGYINKQWDYVANNLEVPCEVIKSTTSIGDCRKCNTVSNYARLDFGGLCYDCSTQGR